jgi:hypothetical protein
MIFGNANCSYCDSVQFRPTRWMIRSEIGKDLATENEERRINQRQNCRACACLQVSMALDRELNTK